MNKCDYCQHVEMCGWRKSLEGRGCDFFDDGNKRKGHWIDIGSKSFEFHKVYKCSECGTTEIEYPESIHRHFRYCPNCGAKMQESDMSSS